MAKSATRKKANKAEPPKSRLIEPVDDAPRSLSPVVFKQSDQRKQRALQTFAAGKSVTAAAEAAGVDRVTLYAWRRAALEARTLDDEETVNPKHVRPDFADQWEDAVEAGVDKLEDEAHRRAHEGVLRPVFQGGECVGHVREFSDTLMIISLKGKRPERYKDRQELSGPGNTPLVPSSVEVTFVNAAAGNEK